MKNRGFTLIEMIVSLAIFSVVAVIAIGALLKVVDANKKAQSIQSSVIDLNFAMESMSRDIRTGTDFDCETSVPSLPTSQLSSVHVCSSISNGAYIAFNSSRTAANASGGTCNLITAYAFVGSSPNIELQKAEQRSCTDTSYSFYDLISPTDMTISNYELGALYDSDSTAHYPLVFIRVTGYAGDRAQDQTYVDLETAVSARSQQ